MRKKTGWLFLFGGVALGWVIWKFRREKDQTLLAPSQPEPARATILLEPDGQGGCRLADVPVRPDPFDIRQQQEVSWVVEHAGTRDLCEGLDVRVLRFRYVGPLAEREHAELAHASRGTSAFEESGPLELSDEARAFARLGGSIVDRVRAEANPGRYKYDLELSRNRDPIQVIDPEVRVRPWP